MKADHFVLLLLGVSSYFLFLVYEPFIQSILIALLLALATFSLMKQLKTRLSSHTLCAVIMTVLLALLLFGPLFYLLNSAAVMLVHIKAESIQIWIANKRLALDGWLQSDWLPAFLDQSMHELKMQIDRYLQEVDFSGYAQKTLVWAGNLVAKSAVFLKDMSLILIFYFFTNLYGPRLGNFVKSLLPLKSGQTTTLFNDLSSAMGVVLYATIVTAFLEGMLFALIILFFDFNPILLGILYGFASLVPVVGGALVWVPTSLYLWSSGDGIGALVIAIYTVTVISLVADTLIKPLIIKTIDFRLNKEHHAPSELLVFFSILAGLTTFGFWGIIIGPAMTTIFLTVLKIYNQMQQERNYHATL